MAQFNLDQKILCLLPLTTMFFFSKLRCQRAHQRDCDFPFLFALICLKSLPRAWSNRGNVGDTLPATELGPVSTQWDRDRSTVSVNDQWWCFTMLEFKTVYVCNFLFNKDVFIRLIHLRELVKCNKLAPRLHFPAEAKGGLRLMVLQDRMGWDWLVSMSTSADIVYNT